MNVGDIHSLYAFTDWANDRTLTSIEQLSDEQFSRSIGGSFPTIRDTAGHIAAAEWIWMRRFHGESPMTWPAWLTEPTQAALRAKFDEIRTERSRYLSTLRESDLDTRLDYRRFNGDAQSKPIGHLLRHVVNHSTYHRGQIATMIRQVGGTPIGTDLLNFQE